MLRNCRSPLLFLLALCVTFSVRSAMAQALMTYEGGNPVSMIQKALPGVTTVATSTGVTANAANDAIMKPSLFRVPVSAAANVSKARILSGALGCSTPLGAIACVVTAGVVVNELLNAPTGMGRYRICPNGVAAFICKPDPSTLEENAYNWRDTNNLSGVQTSPGAVCQFMLKNYTPSSRITWTVRSSDGNGIPNAYDCRLDGGGPSGHIATRMSSCNSGYTYNAGRCTYTGAPKPDIAAVDSDVQSTLQQKMDADFATNKRLYDAMKADQATAGATYPSTRDPVQQDTPVVVTAAPATTPPRTVSTETIPNPDGSTSTRTRSETTTFTPQTTGSTAGASKIEFPSQTTTTITTVNNTTGASSTETNVANNYPPAAEPKPLDLPTDYARDATVAQVRDEIKASGAPALPDQKAVVDAAKAKSDTDLQALRDGINSGQANDKAGFFSWVWAPPIGTCVPINTTVSNGLLAVGWNICSTVADIRSVLEWLLAIGSAWSIYGQLFRRIDA